MIQDNTPVTKKKSFFERSLFGKISLFFALLSAIFISIIMIPATGLVHFSQADQFLHVFLYGCSFWIISPLGLIISIIGLAGDQKKVYSIISSSIYGFLIIMFVVGLILGKW